LTSKFDLVFSDTKQGSLHARLQVFVCSCVTGIPAPVYLFFIN